MFRRLFQRKRQDTPMRDLATLTAPLASPALHLAVLDTPSLSHFGGSPNLPANVPWPEHNGKRLGFLARLSLPEMHRAHAMPWLPASGALLFFYDIENQPWGFDPKDHSGWAVRHVTDLPSPALPSDAGTGGDMAVPHRNAGFRRIATLPSWEREAVKALQLTSEESDEFARIADAPFGGKPKHQVAGFPAPVQGDAMELECQLASHGLYCGDSTGYKDPRAAALKDGASDWRLLFQLDTDDDLGVMWGDGGTLYFWVKETDARAGNFTNAWLVLQCY